jgi:hypothetical protein
VANVSSPHDTWATAKRFEDDLPVIYRYRQNRPHGSNPLLFPSAIRVIWLYDKTAWNGMPSVDENELQIAFEDAIGPLTDGLLGYLMLVFTGNGRKEWLFYVRDHSSWMTTLSDCLESHPAYPLHLEDWLDETWDVWQQFTGSLEAGY